MTHDTAGLRGPDEGLRERKKRATRRALRLAALRLVADRGIEHVTADEIASAADVSPRTFFNYFASKEDALVGNDPDLPRTVGDALAARPSAEDPVAALRAVFVSHAGDVVLDQDIWTLRAQVVRATPQLVPAMLAASAELERAIATGVAARIGADAQDLYPALVAAVTAAAARTAVRHSGAAGFARPLAEEFAEVFDALAAGLPVPGRA